MYRAKQAGTGVHGTATASAPDIPPATRCRDLRRRT